jgi:hypothetical protein
MVYLENERLAREALTDAAHESGVGVAHCPECGAQVVIHAVDETTDATHKGVCRCLCGLYWEVELTA